jgi:hypothetical protein
MVKEIMHSDRGAQLIADIKQALQKVGGMSRLPAKIEGIKVPAGYGFEYEVDVYFSEKDRQNRSFIGIIIHGDTEPEGFAQDPSC